MQAFPPPDNQAAEEFYLSGVAVGNQDQEVRQSIITDLGIRVAEGEVLFELFLERAMYTWLIHPGTGDERPQHKAWHA